MDWIWKAILIIIVGTIILRIAGRKSISQMTLSQTVIMIAIGSLLIQPVAGKNIWVTFGVGGVLVLTLIMMEFTQLKFDFMERFLTGRSISIIENGQLNEKNLKKLRFTVDQLEMKLRQTNITSIADLKSATLEPNGQVGYELKEEKRPATKKDIDDLNQQIQSLRQMLNPNQAAQPADTLPPAEDLFKEVETKQHQQVHPDRLN
ncbi:Protein of unknown function [Halobacillus karajensis]|uniref:YetF C-terminal domain-containing protein n=1 Tax=Halobacillus karajensis TaxID=195088 RepID=A0A024P6P5_9BACI|nr:DUF421 domain-containing protein [Halobacillus karajensis]CDQ20509.1 hypothetical protein BN982_02851 [Halobacillus karajensis]CDQ24022.1 hypothetical protein BN983_02286 [Halobacillus karajensis]CDQ27500.1 hypothetical protein BN981_01767 [Halobacillus karajensis]SEH90678.1 Protein of unknown function [Halobacillus karajensis]